MSNNVYGYLYPPLSKEAEVALKSYFLKCPIHIRNIEKEELINYPEEYLPQDGCFIFEISDGPESTNATYLIDYYEYDPDESRIGFPPDPRERLGVLLSVIFNMVTIAKSKKMVVAINECEQIENVRTVKLSDCCEVIQSDFEKFQAPPDTLYEIIG